MTTKFDIGEMVHIKAVISHIKIGNDGKPKYTLWVDKIHTAITMPEEYLTRIGGADEPIQDTVERG